MPKSPDICTHMYILCLLPKTRRKLQPVGHYFDLYQNKNNDKNNNKNWFHFRPRGNLRFTLCVKLHFPHGLSLQYIPLQTPKTYDTKSMGSIWKHAHEENENK